MVIMSGSTIAPPKRNKNASKKNKKSWRKNTDLDQVEEFLEDQRLEERLGGAFKERPDDSLFVEDTLPTPKQEVQEEETNPRLAKRKARAEKKLKCFSHIEPITEGCPDPLKQRPIAKTAEQRKAPWVKKREEERIKAGIRKPKEIQQQKHRLQALAAKQKTHLERTTRRRTKFDFDLWDQSALKSDQKTEEIKTNQWIAPQTKDHVLKTEGKLRKALPKDYKQKMTSLPSVEVPAAGASYNPSYSDHQDLLWKAAVVEMKKEKAQQKIDYHTTRMFPDVKDAPTHQTWLSEMSEGIDGENVADDDSDNEEENKKQEGSGSEDDEDKPENKLKTRKQRRKAKLAKAAEAKRAREIAQKQKNQDVFRLRNLRKKVVAEEELVKQKTEKRKLAKVAKLAEPTMLSGNKFEDPELEIKLTDELTGNLRSLKPEGNLLADRFKSLQRRNVIETRVKQKIVRNPKKRKRLEKRSYKMPWQKEEPIGKNHRKNNRRKF